MAESHVISALVSKRAELAGQALKLQTELARVQAQLSHIDSTIKVFAPEYRVSSIKAKLPRNHEYPHGEIARLVLESLRELDGRATTRQLVDAIHAVKGIADPTTKAIGDMQKRVNSYLKRNPDTFVKAGMDAAGATVWRVAGDLFD